MKKITLLLCSLFAISCGDAKEEGITYDAGPILQNIGTNVILATYADLDSKANDLLSAVTALQATNNETNLSAARQAWRNARSPWEKSEGFLFGPVDTKGIDPSIDSWPVNKVDLEAVLSSEAILNQNYVDGLEGTLKGFHTIEYLLWGENGTKAATAFTARENDYLVACAQSLKAATATLKNSWDPSGENFVSEITGAGTGGSIYLSQKSAMEELVDGMVGIADEVANGKINDPFSQQNLTLEESQFSDNSKADFQDNIRSILNLYLGSYTIDGMGVADYIQVQNPDIHDRFLDELNHAIDDIGAITGTFSDAVFNHPDDVEHAQDAVRKVQQTLEEDIAPLVSKIQ